MASPAPRSAATAEGAATTGETAAKATGRAAPRGTGPAPRARHRQDDRSAQASAPRGTGLRPTLSCDAAHDHEQDHHEEQKCQQVGYVGLVVRALFGTRLPFLRIDRHVVDPTTDPTCEIVGPQAWDDGILNDELRYRVDEFTSKIHCLGDALNDLERRWFMPRKFVA